MNGPDWTYWLQMMNFAMVAVVVLAGLTVVIAIVWDLQEKKLRQQARARCVDEEMSALFAAESHHIPVAGLGLTMADGGEELEASHRDQRPRRR